MLERFIASHVNEQVSVVFAVLIYKSDSWLGYTRCYHSLCLFLSSFNLTYLLPESLKSAKEAARFSTVYTVFVFLAALLMVVGIDPLQLTLFSMALTAVILPSVIIPFLVLMNDRKYVGDHANGWLSNSVILFTIALTFVLAIVAIPLEIIGG